MVHPLAAFVGLRFTLLPSAAAAAFAANITITDAQIAGCQLTGTGTTAAPNMPLILDGTFMTNSDAAR